jgi:AraC-like DNA-binding protein
LAGDKESSFQGGFLSGTFMENTYLQPLANKSSLLIVQFSEQGLYHLLGSSLGEYRTRSCWNLAKVFGPDHTSLVEQLAKIDAIEGKVKRIEEFIRGKIKLPYGLNPTFKKAVDIIRHEEGHLQIEILCQKLRVSYKWMERNFNKYLGISPKEFTRLQRFLSAYLAMCKTLKQDMLSIAIECGYYDQNHFIKDFKRFTGQTPAYYLNK